MLTLSFFIATCIAFAWEHSQDTTLSPIDSNFSQLSLYSDYESSVSSHSPPYVISKAEAIWYYAGLASCPKLVYRTGKKAWIKPTGPEAYRQLKELRAVFGHRI